MLFRRFTIVVAFALPKIADSAGECFLPDGSKDENDLPCFSNDTVSRCCAPDEFCSTNKLCVLKTGGPRYARGSCLDKNYGPTCPTFCKGIDDKEKVDLLPCGDPSLGEFCCDEGNGYACCSTPSKVLTLGVGSTFTEGSAESTIMTSMSKAPQAKTSTTSRRETSSTSKERSQSSTKVQTETSIKTDTSVQIKTTVQTQTSVEAQTSTQTSIQVQTSAQVITSTQIQTSDQLVTSIQVQTSVQTSIVVVTSVSVPSISIQTQPPSFGIPIGTSVLPPIPEPLTSILPTTINTFQHSTASTQPSAGVISPSSITPFSATAESIVQSSPTSSAQDTPISPIVASEVSSSSGAISSSIIPSQTTDGAASVTSSIIAGAISATNNPATSGGISTAAIVVGSVAGALILTVLIIIGVIYFKKRAEKRASARFETSLGITNFGYEKSAWNGDGGSGKFGFALGKSTSKRSDRKLGNISGPIADRTASPVETLRRVAARTSMAPVELPSDQRFANGRSGSPYQRNSGGGTSNIRPTEPAQTFNMPEQGVPRRFTGDGRGSFGRPVDVGVPHRVVIPERGLERRVSGGTFEAAQQTESAQRPGYPDLGSTFRSETFNKLLYDVQSQPF
ncbi:uncharacterized protein LY89DRAFT_680818 [Mollisia scopiformis]|uniref:Uncharacterized protein n=1 Tax=Mollisia scopiformis TaxID=149040 RepID=A0A194XQY5_MOLSC|nr:uncharacterized protein LY89DRAFT_680818 [Mollisia scopiformis]KUJ22700.1 hypothetical protein LY89DRAFT_680818 [Mollisia scopiformis]